MSFLFSLSPILIILVERIFLLDAVSSTLEPFVVLHAVFPFFSMLDEVFFESSITMCFLEAMRFIELLVLSYIINQTGTFLFEKLRGYFTIEELLWVISLLWFVNTGKWTYSVSIGGSFMVFLLMDLDTTVDEFSSVGEDIIFSERILRRFCCLWILKLCPYIFSHYLFASKLTVFFLTSLLSKGFGSFVFKNLRTRGHLIASIKFTSPLLSNLSMLAYIPPNTVVSRSSEADGLISSSTVKHILISSWSSCEYFEGIWS